LLAADGEARGAESGLIARLSARRLLLLLLLLLLLQLMVMMMMMAEG
jgi:hypothetical protein